MGVLDEKRATLALRTLLKTEDANEILILTEIDNDGKIKYSTVDVTAPAPSTPARSIKVEIPSSTTPVRLVDYMKCVITSTFTFDRSSKLTFSALPVFSMVQITPTILQLLVPAPGWMHSKSSLHCSSLIVCPN
jgi:hypothetical protein